MEQKNQKIAVIGAGFAGLSVAVELLRKGYKVDVVADSSQKPASELALGIVSLKGLYRARQPEFSYKVRGFFCLIKQLRLLQRAFPGFCLYKNTVYEPFFSKLDQEEMTKRIYRFDDDLPPSVHKTSAVHEKSNWFDLYGASVFSMYEYKEDFLVDVDNYIRILKKYITMHGGKLVDKRFTASEKRADGFRLRFNDGSLSKQYSQVVLCLGSQILQYPHVPDRMQKTLKAFKGYILQGSKPLSDKPFGLIRGPKYFGFFGDKWKYGGFSESVSLTDAEQNLAAFIPFLDHKNIASGTRILSKIRTPVVEFSTLGEIIVTGLYKNGLQYAPLVAKKVGRKIMEIK